MPIQVNHVSCATPFVKLFRSLTENEHSSLRDSINSFWVQMPIVVYRSSVYGDSIIDGANRSEIATRIDPSREVPAINLGNIPDDVAEAIARTLNVDRRHLTADEYQKLSAERVARMKRIATLRIGGKSLRDIARVEKISHEQARKDWERATCQPVLTPDPEDEDDEDDTDIYPESPSRILGRDGKSYPATSRRSEPTEDELLKDVVLPGPKQAIFEKLIRLFEYVRRELAALQELNEPLKKRDKQVLIRARNDITAALKRKLAGKRA